VLTRNYSKYSAESLKWSLYGCATFLGMKEEATLFKLATNHFHEYLPKRYASRFFSIRAGSKSSFLFGLQTIWYVLKLHVMAIMNK
jgi:hypothetical protein